MNPREHKERIASPADGTARAKKPYVKPEVRYERVFETRALSCGKVSPSESNCFSIRRAS